MCDGDGPSDLGPLGSERLLRPFLFLERLSPEARLLTWSCIGAVAGEGPWAQAFFGVAERATVEPPGQEELGVDNGSTPSRQLTWRKLVSLVRERVSLSLSLPPLGIRRHLLPWGPCPDPQRRNRGLISGLCKAQESDNPGCEP